MAPSLSKRIDRALATSDDGEFLDRIANVDERFNTVDVHLRPAPLNMLGTLWALHLHSTMHGIWMFIEQDVGDAFVESVEWCREIGAKRAVEYLEKARRVFPRGKVPRDREARQDFLEALEDKSTETGTPDPLRALDGEYADAMPELAQRVRAWVTANRAAMERDIAGADAPSMSDAEKKEIEGALRLLRQLEAMEAAQKDSFEGGITQLRDAAQAAGLIPWNTKTDTANLKHFIESASRLTEKQWTTVATRYHASKKKIEAALDHVMGIDGKLMSGKVVNKSVYRQRQLALMEMIKALWKITDALPKQAVVKGRKIGLLFGAHHAVVVAAHTVRLHDWVLLAPRGAEHARHAYALFEGLAWTPEIPGR